ncbi:MAG: oligoendopeptidase F [Simkania sp.]|nr:oligoendopeptidase F [Simkania sp.]
MLVERESVPADDRWNVEALYPYSDSWVREFEAVQGGSKTPQWSHIEAYRGRLGESADTLAKAIEEILFVDRKLARLYTYAHLRHDEDLAEQVNKDRYEKIMSLCYFFKQQTAWFDPEVLALPQETINTFLEDPCLREYTLFLQRIVRKKEHTLDAKQEELLALSDQALNTAQKAFSAFNNADLKFPPVLNGAGELCQLTHGSFIKYLREEDRTLRENAFKAVHRAFASYENMLAELINGQVQKHLFDMKARKFSSCMEASLFYNEVDPKVYYQLIAAVRNNLPVLHRYMQKRKEWLGVDQLHLYDLYAPVMRDVKISMDFSEAALTVADSVGVLGKEYQQAIKLGLFEQGWVDKYENSRKRSGAYSSGCYDSMPYILMNYNGTFNDARTLAHECGHSMHSYMSHKHQPYQYSNYSIFVAEVASTFNEELMMEHFMHRLNQPEERAFLLCQRIDDIRATFFRQTMFAEFELKIHELAEQGVPLTATLLKTLYRSLNQEYFGETVVIDEEIDWEWARIPHFYYNFYVYQYATGLSAAFALFEKVQHEGEPAVKKYLQFLSSGSSEGPIEILQKAGVDMKQPAAVEALIHRFDYLVNELDEIFKKKTDSTKRLPKIPASSISFGV